MPFVFFFNGIGLNLKRLRCLLALNRSNSSHKQNRIDHALSCVRILSYLSFDSFI
ncbi:hypothetical protein SAMN05216201_11141 [Pseudomonas linyingensis]|uniref:Uncharacterized protein n=1 Tax=Pseudomonas linyingensis TaxID=915471 RepID=A0A1H7A031_9PSED|nr:hypothetical protein SAMN05216201_11141 [Pseudomonas linyingensis]